MSTVADLKKQILSKDKYNIDDLLIIMKILRSEEGCPWDRTQTSYSVRQSLLEESCEAIDAIEKNDPELIKEELGDLLFQIVFHSELYKEQGVFNFYDICDSVSKKMIVRHPHVFGNVSYDSLENQLAGWEEIKNETNGDSLYDAIFKVPNTLPALMKTQKVIKRAEKAGISVEDYTSDIGDLTDNVGKILFSICKYCKDNNIDAEEELRVYTDNFVKKID